MNAQTAVGDCRILVIDDNPAIHTDFRKILAGPVEAPALNEAEAALFGECEAPESRLEFLVETASQGQEGFAMVRAALSEELPFAVAFVDIRMPPGWDGIETTANLWKIDPELQVVLCTAHSDYCANDLVRKLGPSDRLFILKKPFDNIEVQQMVRALTERWWRYRETRFRLEALEKKVRELTAELCAVRQGPTASSPQLTDPLFAA